MHRLILHVLQLPGHGQFVRYMFLLYRRLTLHKLFCGLNHTSPGAFQTFCTQTYLPYTPSSAIFWIGSIQAFLLLIGGIVAGSLYDRGYPHAVVFTGAFLVVLGMMMTSIATSYWRILLAQAVFVGLGNGCLFVPSVSVLPAYFPKNTALALGVAASGSGFGKKPSRQWLFTPQWYSSRATAGVITPIMFHRLQPYIGFGWATRVIAFLMLVTLMVPLAGMKMHTKPTVRRPFFEARA